MLRVVWDGKWFTLLLVVVLSVVLTACGEQATQNQTEETERESDEVASAEKIVKVSFRDFGTANTGLIEWLEGAKEDFENQYPDVTVEFVPIQASEGDFFAKLALMLQSSDTAPDVITEDTFMINADAAAGYLEPLDEYVKDWEDWDKFNERVKVGVTASDGHIYGVPYSTDTRGLYYNVNIFEKAGLPVPWQPKTWDDIITAAETIKEQVPGVIPFWANTGKATGEATSMQTFQMLITGTDDSLYDFDSEKWIVKSQGFLDSLQFIHDIYSKGLGPDLSQVLTGQAGDILQNQLMPEEKVAIVLNGNWVPAAWREGGPAPWPEGTEVYQFTAMPTQYGQAPGFTSMSGGWALSIPALANEKDMAWEFIKIATSKEHNKNYVLKQGDLTPRTDVAEDPDVANAPGTVFKQAASFLDFTNFRPAVENYPAVSNHIQEAVEAVATGSLTPEQAMEQYAEAVKRVVGEENTIEK